MKSKYSVKVAVVFAPNSETEVKIQSSTGKPGAKEVIDWIQNNEEYIGCCDALVIRVTGDLRVGDTYVHEGSLWLKNSNHVVSKLEYDEHRNYSLIKEWFDKRYDIQPYSISDANDTYTITEAGECKSRR